ncbi:hypothetical protein D3C87_1689630 [compost metagenome]
MICPGSRVTSYGASLFASHATPLAGWLSTAALTPDSSITPLRYRTAGIFRRSTSVGRTGRPPITTPAFAALSEIVSNTFRVTLVCGSTWWIRASMISSAGMTHSVASRTSNTVTLGPLRGLPRMKASSTSTRGTIKRLNGMSVPSSKIMSSSSAP